MNRGLLASFAVVALAAAMQTPRVGDVAPGFKLVDQNNHATTLDSARKHKVVLVFYRGYW